MTDTHADLLGRARFIRRDGCKIAYRVTGDVPGRRTLMLFSAWQIVHSAAWRGQVPYLSAFYRVITIDCRGNGLSDRPDSTGAYSPWELVADSVAILDAEGLEDCVIGGFSYGGHLAALFAATHPHRCRGAVLLAPAAPFGPTNPAFAPDNMLAERDRYAGWQKYNFNYWKQDYKDAIDFFVREVFPEPHSAKQIEDACSWGQETDAPTLIHTIAARRDSTGQREEAYRAIRCPVLLIHGTDDRVIPYEKGRMLAQMLGADFVTLEGSGHFPNGRIPAIVNRHIKDFLDGLFPPTDPVKDRPATPQIAPRGLNRAPRALYLSSPIGLGHVRRDRAIADALRHMRPGLVIDWLAQDPVTGFLEAAGEFVHPVSARLLSESRHIEAESGEHDLHAFEALRRMDAILVANFGHFQDLVDKGDYDLVIADEAWDIDRFWHEHPELKRAKLAWMTDFVGVLPVAGASPREEELAADWNSEMIEFVEGRPDTRDAALFVGDPDDIVDRPFGDGLPSIRNWCREHFTFPGYPNPLETLSGSGRTEMRQMLGHRQNDIVCLVAVGGSGVGHALIKRVLHLVPALRTALPALKFEIVTGPRISAASLPSAEGARVHAYVSDFPALIQASDVALVQGGLSTTMELTCLGKPFLYVPLENHFEQQIHVHHRLKRHGAGERLSFGKINDPDELAARLLDLAGRAGNGALLPVRAGGVDRTASAIATLL